ncbi:MULTISPECIES: hypothetical protein [Polaribacter]|uniref:Lipocalin-like domain-containing protein n=1 Tax=Polaribacter sejongensis TaxID=985043 RepID=A0ABM6Q1M5_9FLAO|nr:MULTISPECIES: hypothetical protein [Polaribacter]AUC23073.1 hypothetical protein BTO15_13650 [Polaribacter sejongensis]
MKHVYIFLLIISSLFLYNCSKDDKDIDVRYTIDDLQKIHGNSSKTWKVEAFYKTYENDVLSELNECYTDDEYTFFYDKNEAQVTLGNISCYYDNPTEQEGRLTYSFYEDSGKIFINISKGESLNENFRTELTILGLEELSETRMVFTAGDYPYYGKALVFTSVP